MTGAAQQAEGLTCSLGGWCSPPTPRWAPRAHWPLSQPQTRQRCAAAVCTSPGRASPPSSSAPAGTGVPKQPGRGGRSGTSAMQGHAGHIMSVSYTARTVCAAAAGPGKRCLNPTDRVAGGQQTQRQAYCKGGDPCCEPFRGYVPVKVTCVVFPQPVSPLMRTTWLPATAWTMCSLDDSQAESQMHML